MSELQIGAEIERLGLDPSKPTVLVVSDSAAIHSGFAQVVRNVFRRLWKHKEWNIVQFGWWHAQPMESVPWPIITTRRNPQNPNYVDMADKYGEQSFEEVVGALRPDLVWIMGDPWMVSPTLNNPNSDTYTKVLYMPVDGAPLVYGWDVCKAADVVVPYLPWGTKMIKRWVPEAKLAEHIPHGVDTELFNPEGPIGDRARVRKEVCGVDEDDILILSVCRNQARKNIPAMIELMYYIRSGDYRTCQNCGRAVRNPFDYHLGKPTGEKGTCRRPECLEGAGPGRMVEGKPNENVYYYLHTPIKDLVGHSWRITDLLDIYGLGVPTEDGKSIRYPGFRWNQELQPVHGMREQDLASMYRAADIFSMATVGEGFGLPILESMSCGTPVVVPDISSHPDFINEGGGMLVDIGYHINEPVSSYYRGYPDMDDYLTKLLILIENGSLRQSLGKAARETALRYDWDGIAESWRKLINKYMTTVRPPKRWHKVTTV